MSRPVEIRALLLDMDGVIIDSNPLHRMVWEKYNRLHGLETTDEMQRRMYGKRNDEIIRDFYGPALNDEEVFRRGADKDALYREMLLPLIESTLVPGVREFLHRHRNLSAAVATNAETANVDFVLQEAGLRACFRTTVDGHQVQNPKPHPEVYLCAAQRLGVSPEYCVVFEDSVTGVSAGLAAGMRVVGLSTTHHHLQGTSLLVPDFNDPALEAWMVEPV